MCSLVIQVHGRLEVEGDDLLLLTGLLVSIFVLLGPLVPIPVLVLVPVLPGGRAFSRLPDSATGRRNRSWPSAGVLRHGQRLGLGTAAQGVLGGRVDWSGSVPLSAVVLISLLFPRPATLGSGR